MSITIKYYHPLFRACLRFKILIKRGIFDANSLIKAPEIFDNIFKLLLKKWRKKDLLIKILNRRQALRITHILGCFFNLISVWLTSSSLDIINQMLFFLPTLLLTSFI